MNDELINDPEFTLSRKIGRLARLMHRYQAYRAKAAGLVGNPVRGQGRVLALLKNRPETSQRELSYLLDMRQQSLSELLAKLEDKGYITRSKSETDGRVTVVRLTEEGARAVPDIDDMGGEADTFSSLSQADLAKFEEVVDALTISLKEKLVAMGDDPDDFRHGRGCRRGFGYGPHPERDDDFCGRRHGHTDPEDHHTHRA